MTRYEATMMVPRKLADELDLTCSVAPEENLGKSPLFDEEAIFPNGKMVCIQVCPACDEESPWTQGVLFEKDVKDEGFYEIGCTDVQDRLTGEYEVQDGEGDEYCVTIVAADVDESW